MPCFDPDARDLRAHEYCDNALLNRALDKVDALTRILCDACRSIEENNELWPTEVMMNWWKEHQKSEGHQK